MPLGEVAVTAPVDTPGVTCRKSGEIVNYPTLVRLFTKFGRYQTTNGSRVWDIPGTEVRSREVVRAILNC